MHRRLRRYARDALRLLWLASLSGCSGCFLSHTSEEDAGVASSDAGFSCTDASGRDSIDGWVRPYPPDINGQSKYAFRAPCELARWWTSS